MARSFYRARRNIESRFIKLEMGFDLLHPDHEAELTATLEVEKPTDQLIDGSSIPLA